MSRKGGQNPPPPRRLDMLLQAVANRVKGLALKMAKTKGVVMTAGTFDLYLPTSKLPSYLPPGLY